MNFVASQQSIALGDKLCLPHFSLCFFLPTLDHSSPVTKNSPQIKITKQIHFYLFCDNIYLGGDKLDPIHSNFPKGNPVDAFEKGAAGKFESALYNLALDKDVAKKRNLIYLGLVVICVIATVLVTTTFSYKTYVVRVDNATGQVMAGGELKATNYSPQEADIKYFLKEYLEDTRTVPLDPIQFKRNWDAAQALMTQEAMTKLNNYLAKDNPANKLGKNTVQPKIKSIQLQPGTNSTYQIRWSEESYQLSGNTLGKPVNYVGLFTIKLDPPKDEETLKVNPLGLYIVDLAITKEDVGGNDK